MSVTDIVYRINADTTRFSRELRFAEKDIRRLERRASSRFRKMGRAAGIMAGALVTGLGAMTRQGINMAAEMDQAGRELGMATEEISRLKVGAREADVEFNTLRSRMDRFNRQVRDAAQGSGDLADVLDEQNISLRDSNDEVRDQTDLILDLAQAVEDADEHHERLAITTAAFGERGGEMLKMLEQGPDVLQENMDSAEELGEVIDSDTGAAAQRFQASMRTLTAVGRSYSLSLANELLPTLTGYTESVGEAAQESDRFSQSTSVMRQSLQTVLVITEMARAGFVALSEGIGASAATMHELEVFSPDMAMPTGGFMGVAENIGQGIGERIGRGLAGDDQVEQQENTVDRLSAIWSGFGDEYTGIMEESAERIEAILGDIDLDEGPDIEELLADEEERQRVQQEYEQWLSERESLAEQWQSRTRDVFEQHRMDFDELKELYEDGFVDEEVLERGGDMLRDEVQDHFAGVVSEWEGGQDELLDAQNEALQKLAEQFDEGLIDEETFDQMRHFLDDELNARLEELAEEERERMRGLEEEADRFRAQLEGIDLHMKSQLETLENLREEGVISMSEYRDMVEMVKDETEEVAEATDHLADFAESAAQRIGRSLITEITDPFRHAGDEVESFGERASRVLRDLTQQLARMALQQALTQGIGAAFGGGFAEGGQVPQMSTGGQIRGPGTSTSDSIPIMASDGEYMIRASSVRHYGSDFMHGINTKQVPKFASGGQVGSRSAGGGGRAGAPVDLTVIVVRDREEILDVMGSSDGEAIIVDAGQRNRVTFG